LPLPAWRRPKAEFKARESPPSEAYFPYAAASAESRPTPKSALPLPLPAWRRPKAEFKARESPPSEAYFAYAAASAESRPTPKSASRRRH
jgi:hypothetical protein